MIWESSTIMHVVMMICSFIISHGHYLKWIPVMIRLHLKILIVQRHIWCGLRGTSSSVISCSVRTGSVFMGRQEEWNLRAMKRQS